MLKGNSVYKLRALPLQRLKYIAAPGIVEHRRGSPKQKFTDLLSSVQNRPNS